jgi:SAM-dependent methyltransferase
MQERAREILRSLEGEAGLIEPPQTREWWLGYLRKQRQRYLSTLSFLGEADRGCRLLEVGSVPGHFTVVLKGLGFDVRGVDVDPARVRPIWERHGLSVEKVDIEREPLPFPEGSFDLALFTEVLEHLRVNPLHALRQVARVLAPGGRLLLSTPNITLAHRLQFLLGRSYQGDPVEAFRKLEWLGHMGHVRLYSVAEVKAFLRCVGLEPVRCVWKREGQGGRGAGLIRRLYPVKRHVCPFLYVVARKEGPPLT